MFLKHKMLFDRDGVAGALLALSIISILTFPVRAIADEPGAPGDSQIASGQQSAAILATGGTSASQTPAVLNGLPGLNAKPITTFAMSPPGTALEVYKLSQPNLLPPVFGAGRLADQTASALQPEAPKTGVNKRYLALGIFGLVDVAAGAIAISQSNKSCLTTNITTSGQSQTTCSSVPTAGKVLIPVGAAIAGLGFYLAFRHRH